MVGFHCKRAVDWSGRHEDSCGSSVTGETPQEQSDEEAHRTAPRKAKCLQRKSTDLFESQYFNCIITY